MKSSTKRYLISFLVGFGSSIIFLLFPLYAKKLGANYSLIGLIVSIYAISSALTFYLAGHFSDSKALRKNLISTGLALVTLAAILHYFASSLLFLTFARILYGLGIGLYTGPMIAYVGGTGSRKAVGSFLGFQSLGWGTGVFIGGYLTGFFSLNFLFAVFSVPFFMAFIISLLIHYEKISKIKIPLVPINLIKKNSALFTSFLLRNLAAHAIWMLMPLYVVFLGGTAAFVSYLFGINSFVQFFVMNLSARAKLKDTTLIRIGLVVSIFVFILVAITPSLQWLIPIFFLLGIAWGTLYVGSNTYLLKKNMEKATVAGLLQSSRSIGVILGPPLSGFLVLFFGFRATILIISVIAFIAMLIGFKIKE